MSFTKFQVNSMEDIGEVAATDGWTRVITIVPLRLHWESTLKGNLLLKGRICSCRAQLFPLPADSRSELPNHNPLPIPTPTPDNYHLGAKNVTTALLPLKKQPFPLINAIALRTAKTLWSFGYFECNKVKHCEMPQQNLLLAINMQHLCL